MIDPEKFFQQIYKKEWRNILIVLHQKKSEIQKDVMLSHAALTFENAFITEISKYPLEDKVIQEDLVTFWQLHHGKFYKLNDDNYKKLIYELIKRSPYSEARAYAALIPDDSMSQELLLNKKQSVATEAEQLTNLPKGQKNKIAIKMPQFGTEIRETFEKKYVKVFLRDNKRLSEIQVVLNELPSVKRVNITQNQEVDLTVYPKKLYDVEEVEKEIKETLTIIFASKAADPILKEDVLNDGISSNAYQTILSFIDHFGKNLEKFISLRSKFDEEGYREYFLPYLNSMSISHTTTGETFNKNGRTDILIQNTKGENVFIAECKVWSGVGDVQPAINQLLQRYVNWRDEKLALIIFNKTVKGFSDIIEKAIEGIKDHSDCKKYNGKTGDSRANFTFKHPEDDKKEVDIELMMFNCN